MGKKRCKSEDFLNVDFVDRPFQRALSIRNDVEKKSCVKTGEYAPSGGNVIGVRYFDNRIFCITRYSILELFIFSKSILSRLFSSYKYELESKQIWHRFHPETIRTLFYDFSEGLAVATTNGLYNIGGIADKTIYTGNDLSLAYKGKLNNYPIILLKIGTSLRVLYEDITYNVEFSDKLEKIITTKHYIIFVLHSGISINSISGKSITQIKKILVKNVMDIIYYRNGLLLYTTNHKDYVLLEVYNMKKSKVIHHERFNQVPIIRVYDSKVFIYYNGVIQVMGDTEGELFMTLWQINVITGADDMDVYIPIELGGRYIFLLVRGNVISTWSN